MREGQTVGTDPAFSLFPCCVSNLMLVCITLLGILDLVVDAILDKLCQNWNEDCNSCYSDECVVEQLIDNGCMFLQTGQMFNYNRL